MTCSNVVIHRGVSLSYANVMDITKPCYHYLIISTGNKIFEQRKCSRFGQNNICTKRILTGGDTFITHLTTIYYRCYMSQTQSFCAQITRNLTEWNFVCSRISLKMKDLCGDYLQNHQLQWQQMNILIQFRTLRKLCSFVRSNRSRNPIASLKNAVVKLRNLKSFRKDFMRNGITFDKDTGEVIWYRSFSKVLHVPLLSGSVPQLHVDLLTFSWGSILTWGFVDLTEKEKKSNIKN